MTPRKPDAAKGREIKTKKDEAYWKRFDRDREASEAAIAERHERRVTLRRALESGEGTVEERLARIEAVVAALPVIGAEDA